MNALANPSPTPEVVAIHQHFPNFQLVPQKKQEPLHKWIYRLAVVNGSQAVWKFEYSGQLWRCTLHMKMILLASAEARKKSICQAKTCELALGNLKMAVDYAQVARKKSSVEAETLSTSCIQENILSIQRKIMLNQAFINESITETMNSAISQSRNVSSDNSAVSFFNNQVVRVENLILMKQNLIFGCAGSFSVSCNKKLCKEFKQCEEQYQILSHQNGMLGELSKSTVKMALINEEALYLIRECETLGRRNKLAVDMRMASEKWSQIIRNQSTMLDNMLEIMCTLSAVVSETSGDEFLKDDDHLCFIDNVITTKKYTILFHENEIAALHNDIMHRQNEILNAQKMIIDNEKKLLKGFNLCVFSKDMVYEMSRKSPFYVNYLSTVQLKTWAGINHLLANLNQKYMDRIENPCRSDDIINLQSEVIGNQKAILANLGRFPCVQAVVCENQKLILDVQNEVLRHCVPAVNNNEPLGEDNVGFKLLEALGWSGGELGVNHQGIAEPMRAEGSPRHRSGFGYTGESPENRRKNKAISMANAKVELQNLKQKLLRFKECPPALPQERLPNAVNFCTDPGSGKVASLDDFTEDNFMEMELPVCTASEQSNQK